MKKLSYLFLIVICFYQVSCKKESTTINDSNYKYYVLANIDTLNFKAENDVLQECWSSPYGFCTEMYNGTNFNTLGYVFFHSGELKPQSPYILGMKGKTYSYFSPNLFSPSFVFTFILAGVNFSTDYVPVANRNGSVVITDVIADGETNEFDDLDSLGNDRYDKCYKIVGNFTGKIAKSDSSGIKQITNGRFTIRFNETKRN